MRLSQLRSLLITSGKATGFDNILMSIIKESIQIIAEALAHIVNLSISNGIVPDQMKIESFSTEDEHDYEYEFSSFSQLYS